MYILVNVVNIAFSIIGILFESDKEQPNVFVWHIVVFAGDTNPRYLPIYCRKYDIHTPDSEDRRVLT